VADHGSTYKAFKQLKKNGADMQSEVRSQWLQCMDVLPPEID